MLNFVPKKSKYKKYHKNKNNIKKISFINLEEKTSKKLILKATEPGFLNSAQILSIKQKISKFIKKNGSLDILIFPQKPVSKKPLETRMGKGKGNISYWVSEIKEGEKICEIIPTIYSTKIKKAIKTIRFRIPFASKIM
jgi:large subunit ribosomal protein L16